MITCLFCIVRLIQPFGCKNPINDDDDNDLPMIQQPIAELIMHCGLLDRCVCLLSQMLQIVIAGLKDL